MLAQLLALPTQPADELVAIDHDDRDPRGKRYTPEDRETAYLVWKAHGRSITKAADKIGATEATVGNWKRGDGWDARAAREDRITQGAARATVAATIATELEKSIATVVEIRDDTTAAKRDRFLAATWLAGVAGVAPVVKADTSIFAQTEPATPHLPDAVLDGMSPLERIEHYRRTMQRRTS